jgi:hypothetical protein
MTTSHANCSHPTTKAARAACRGQARTKRIAAARHDVAMIASRGQMDKVNEVLELGGVIRIRRTFYRVVCTVGGHTYICDTVSGNCTCGYGLHRMRCVAKARKDGSQGAEVCYHVLAARVKAASYVSA